MKIAKRIFTILCDDVREEKSNKLTLVGVYSKDIVFKEIPSIYPKLCLVIFVEGIKDLFANVKVILKVPESEDIVIIMKPPQKISLNNNINLVLAVSPFRIKTTGLGQFQIYFGNAKKPSLIHEFEIKVVD